jgi:glycosyltransferase involved in cell wall biosynthesis
VKRVLFLAYLFPPIANSGTQRPLKFAKYLRQHGWAPTVLTAAAFEGHATDPALLDDIPQGLDVVRVPMLHQRIEANLRCVLGATIGGALGGAIGWRWQLRNRTPDLYALWRREVTRAAITLFRDYEFDAIYATGFPWTSLLAGVDIARATGKPLIADFRDLWAGESLFREARPKHDVEVKLEACVLHEARTVVTASASIMRALRNAHPDVAPDKFVTIHNGFDAADMSTRPERTPQRPFRIVFTGVWKDGYNPADLYDSIDWLRRANPRLLDGVEVMAAGFTPGEARRRGLSSIIIELGVVPHRQAVDLMQSADLLYLSHVDLDRQWVVPGKIYEYLASGTPVLALTHPGRETAQILEAVGGAVVVSPDDPGTLYQVLGDICRTKTFNAPPRKAAALAQFERQALTARLAAVLDDAYTTRSKRAGSSAGSPTRSSYTGSTSAQPATRVVS